MSSSRGLSGAPQYSWLGLGEPSFKGMGAEAGQAPRPPASSPGCAVLFSLAPFQFGLWHSLLWVVVLFCTAMGHQLSPAPWALSLSIELCRWQTPLSSPHINSPGLSTAPDPLALSSAACPGKSLLWHGGEGSGGGGGPGCSWREHQPEKKGLQGSHSLGPQDGQ